MVKALHAVPQVGISVVRIIDYTLERKCYNIEQMIVV
jgi:hypothetical protein